MTRLFNDPAQFASDALLGFVDAYGDDVVLVPGGVVRRTPSRAGKVAVVVGGGSGHYPAFCGLVGDGFADGAVVGDVFTSPSTDDVVSVARAADAGAGVVLLTGNYAGDVMNFTLAARQLVATGVETRYVLVTDDVASAPIGHEDDRRGIAGDLAVFKVAAAAAEAGWPIDEVERVARHANDMTRTLGVAFDGCTLPGSTQALFTVPVGRMGLGVGIHGEPGIGEEALPTAADLASLLVERVLSEAPAPPPARAAVILNGLGRTKYEELFVVWASVGPLLRQAGVTVVEPDIGELVTSLDMAGCSLTLMWLDEQLEEFWRAPTATPAYRKGAMRREPMSGHRSARKQPGAPLAAEGRSSDGTVCASERARAQAVRITTAIEAAARAIAEHERDLGELDAIAGDGDHGRGMLRGVLAAQEATRLAVAEGHGGGETLIRAGHAWASKAGGTSGVLWGTMLEAAGRALHDDEASWQRWDAGPTSVVADAVSAGVEAVRSLGGAKVGDKTMLDALVPLQASLAQAAALGRDLDVAWPAAAAEAERAADATASLSPQLGRARPLAARSIGHPDPGAVSLALIATAVAPSSSPPPSSGPGA